ncbi:MAG: hypothetical protein DRM99_05165 [Thermoplasmata archaeon]|nr:MAG: hypothetical protein DRM99_05165 [Thermoplasmata archaeon]
MILHIEGNIGAGKSTFIEALSKLLPWINIEYEKLDEWRNVGGVDLFNVYYNNPEKFGFHFEVVVLSTRIKTEHRITETAKNHLVVMERSMYSEKIFARYLFEKKFPITYNCYCKLHEMWETLKPADLEERYVYLTTPPDVCMNNIKKRNRKGEENITMEFLEELDKLHHETFCSLSLKDKVLVVPWKDCQWETQIFDDSNNILEFLFC